MYFAQVDKPALQKQSASGLLTRRQENAQAIIVRMELGPSPFLRADKIFAVEKEEADAVRKWILSRRFVAGSQVGHARENPFTVALKNGRNLGN